ncbi:MAG: hypothetical protein MH252_10365 [Thermosynechococcaceae cyanobacterium MS004]|nr:hypothetical protein [Thermosynechococcaceae cyanobacterium MS004]
MRFSARSNPAHSSHRYLLSNLARFKGAGSPVDEEGLHWFNAIVYGLNLGTGTIALVLQEAIAGY